MHADSQEAYERRCGVWPAVRVELRRDDPPAIVAADRTLRLPSCYGQGRVWEVVHRVEAGIGGARARGRAELDVDVWTGDVLRVRYALVTEDTELAVQQCGSYRDHAAILFAVARRVGRALATLDRARGALLGHAASGLERRCARTLRELRRASADWSPRHDVAS